MPRSQELSEMAILTGITAFSLLLLLMLVFFREYLVRYWHFKQKVSKLPTIDYNFFLGHLIYGFVPFNKIRDTMKELLDISPPICLVWFGPVPGTAIYRAKDLEKVLTNPNCNDKPFFYKFLSPWLGDGLLLSGGTKWHTRRKLLTPAFHFKILENFVEIFAKKSNILVKKLKREIESDSFDVTPYISMCTLDVICETAMGVEINAQDMEKYSEYVNALCKISIEVMNRIMFPWYYIDAIYYLSPPGRRFKKYVKILHNFTRKVVRDRKQYYAQINNRSSSDENMTGVKKRMAFLDLLLEASNDGANLTEEDIREEVDTFMFEGHDTTTSALCWALQLLGGHLEVQEEAYREQENIFLGSDREPTMKELSEMKYLERVIKETLRLYPSVPLLGRYAKGDTEVDGHLIPAGVNFGTSFYFTHRDTEYFSDPETFNPDNFLPENTINRHPFAYVPFSAGPRNCIGQKFAMLEMKMVLSYILRYYSVIATREDPVPLPELVTRPDGGIHIKIIPRTS